jgi:hypothetical protein
MISFPGLQCTLLLLFIFEQIALFPRQLQLLMASFVGKAKGGYRVIHLFIALYRVWVRLRRSLCRQWEAGCPRPYLAFSRGIGAARIVWRQAAKAECNQEAHGAYAAVLWDLKDYYEHLNTEGLLQCCMELGVLVFGQMLSCCMFLS